MKPFKTISFSLFLCMPLLLSGCNTVAGAGKDIQKGGEGIQKIATTKKEDKSQKSTSHRRQSGRQHMRTQAHSDSSPSEQDEQTTENS